MYRIGFGDCFLVSLPAASGVEHILVDCGVHAKGDIKTMDRAVADIAKETGKSLAVVIATHAHQDHISGFARQEQIFTGFKVNEVWLPWTENPRDAQAAKLKAKRQALVALLTAHAAAAAVSPAAVAALLNVAGNDEALRLLNSGFGNTARVRYLEAGNTLDAPAGLTGLSVRILGPPRDETLLAKMDPPSDQRFLHLGANGTVQASNAILPFGKAAGRPRAVAAGQGPVLSRPEERAVAQVTETPADDLAFTLDQALNNTSVVALLEYRGRALLFPGDAQYGNWRGWMDADDAATLLSDICFYKVAHHGSYNATPKAAIAKMPAGGFAAMASTQSVPWASIPLAKLMKALADRSKNRVVRSDSLSITGAPKGPTLSRLPRGFSRGAFWFDYTIPVSS
jgi:hypothetical protein